MYTYTPPLRDMMFVIDSVLDAPRQWVELPGLADFDLDTAGQVLEEAGKFAGGVLAPINSAADLQGCAWQDGRVSTPDGYRHAYRAFVDGGWAALACDPAYGGQGLPMLLNAAFNEMIAAANHGWTMYPGLLHGAYECLKAHGGDELKQRYLTGIVSGEVLATMNLTEPQAGSDVGQIRTRAESAPDGTWRITGSKIFISGGEHDLTENIVHLVLCRLPGATAGSSGLSLLLAPRILPDGSRNAIRCDGIEKKMGIKGSATCAMSFEGATGWLVGEAHRGLASMFVMMNSARLHVGLQGLGHLEMAQQNASSYAAERVQGRGASIAEHPSVRRTLWALRAMAEGERVIAYRTAQLIDESHHHVDPSRRAWAESLVAVLTPVVKAFLTENGNRGANDALQVWGGYGYVHEYGIEQTVRDSRIAMIYEGTNEIQAIDLMRRKVLGDAGVGLDSLLVELSAEMELLDETVQAGASARGHELDDFKRALGDQILMARTASRELLTAHASDAEWPLRVASDFLRGLGFTLLAWAWARTARIASREIGRAPSGSGDEWLEDKRHAARFGIEWLLPEGDLCWKRVMNRGAALPPAIVRSR